jgi:hypothetical protein
MRRRSWKTSATSLRGRCWTRMPSFLTARVSQVEPVAVTRRPPVRMCSRSDLVHPCAKRFAPFEERDSLRAYLDASAAFRIAPETRPPLPRTETPEPANLHPILALECTDQWRRRCGFLSEESPGYGRSSRSNLVS